MRPEPKMAAPTTSRAVPRRAAKTTMSTSPAMDRAAPRPCVRLLASSSRRVWEMGPGMEAVRDMPPRMTDSRSLFPGASMYPPLCLGALLLLLTLAFSAQTPHVVMGGVVVSQERLASEAGAQVLREGGSAVDAAVATAFALAVVHPAAGNLGGGGFLLSRPAKGQPTFVDFRETAPASAEPRMWLREGAYDEERHHGSLASVGVPGTVAGLHEAWKREGRLAWPRLLRPAIRLARDGFVLTENQAASLAAQLPEFRKHAPTLAQFSREGLPLRAGDRLVQRDLARTLVRVSRNWADFYRGDIARLILRDMKANAIRRASARA